MTETVIASSVLILVVILLRTVFKGRIKNRTRYALWLIAAARLLMPFSLAESPVSVMNFLGDTAISETFEEAGEAPDGCCPPSSEDLPAVGGTANHNISASDGYGNEWEVIRSKDVPSENYEKADVKSVTAKKLSASDIARIARRSVTAAMLIWFAAVNIIFYAGLRRGRRLIEYNAPLKVYVCGELASPCIFGIIKPSVYVTEEAADRKRALDLVAAHELCHYYHGDIFWTVLRYVLLSVYWFDPLVWLAAILSKRDCECACDEAVIQKFGEDSRFEYGKAIVDMIPQKRSGLFGTASTSMSSSGRVLRERIKFISRIPKNFTSAVLCTAFIAAAAAGCTFTSAAAPPDIYEGNTDVTDGTEPPPAASAGENTVSDLKGDSDLYVKVTDLDGTEKNLFYMLPPTKDGEAFVYMDRASEDPLRNIGYVPQRSEDVPAKAVGWYWGERAAEFIESSRFSAADVSFANGSDVIVRHIKKSRGEEEFNRAADALAAIDPVPADESMISEEHCGEIVFFRENGGFTSRLTVSFRLCGSRVAGQITAEDYSGLVSLITSEKQPPSAEELERAYSESCLAVSEWFYADGTELYKICEGQTARHAASAACESFDADLFSADIAARLEVTGSMPESYIEKKLGDVIVGVPSEGSSSVIGSLLLWQDGGMSFRLRSGSEKDLATEGEFVDGTFCGNRCVYQNNGDILRLVFEDGSGGIYIAVFEGDGTKAHEDTAEKILGSIHLKKAESPVPFTAMTQLTHILM